jgi:hypothetical protein
VYSRTYVIGTQAQEILGPGTYGAILQADSANTADIYLGGLSVTANNAETGGLRLAPGATVPIEVHGNEQLWAVAPSGGQLLRVIVSGAIETVEVA